jgi:hypothetical protein
MKHPETKRKNCLFQYATKHKVYEDTELITRKKADSLLEKYLDDIKKRWNEFESPEMGIWVDCKSNVDYHTMEVDIDFRDCKLIDGHFYKIKKEKII